MRRVRFLVLEALYESETAGHDAETAFARRIREEEDQDPEIALPGPTGLGRGILRGVVRRKTELDEHIQEAARQYPVSTLAVVDRNILRLAIWELLSDNSAPVGAVVNEAVELAHRYGGDSSPGFVNGVLRTVSARIQAARSAEGPPQDAEPSDPLQQET